MRCPKCGEENSASNRFCEACGTPLGAGGASIPKNARVPASVRPEHGAAENSGAVPEDTDANSEWVPVMAILRSVHLNSDFWIKSLMLVLVLAVLLTRFIGLGDKPMHHDESLHATHAWYLFVGKGYHYDPMMHGPFLFHANVIAYFLLGVTDFSARVLPALFGVFLVVLPFLYRRLLGNRAAFLLSLLLSFSPSFLYYARFIRNDIYIAVFSLVMVLAYFSWERDRRPAHLYVAALALGLSFSTKEVTYLNLAVFLPILLARALWHAFAVQDLGVGELWTGFKDRLRKERLYLLVGLILLTFLWFWLVFFPNWGGLQSDLTSTLSTSARMNTSGMMAGLVNVMAGHPALLQFLVIFGFGAFLYASFFIAAFAFRSLRVAFWCSIIALSVPLALFTVLFTEPVGFFNGFVRSWSYWLSQQPVARGSEPPQYYPLLMLLYEQPAVIFGLFGLVFLSARRVFRKRGDALTHVALLWSAGAMIVYTLASEKMPWLLLHLLLPLMLVAAQGIAILWEEVRIRGVRAAIILTLALTGMVQVHSVWLAAYYNPADPREPLVYVQSSPDVKETRDIIALLSGRLPEGNKMRILCETTCDWPFRWYLREYKNVVISGSIVPGDPVILTTREGNDPAHDERIQKALEKTYVQQKYRLRVWWNWLDAPDLDLGKIWMWFTEREPWSGLGSQDYYLWIRKDMQEQSQ